MNLLASLRYLAALDEHKHFGRAAQACHITQPGLSNALRALEEEFGTAIVTRGRTFVGFTAEGERVLVSARRMLHEPEGPLVHWRGSHSRAYCGTFCCDVAGPTSWHHPDGVVPEFR
jgi:DNA-binding transcriptional LysR family regulator